MLEALRANYGHLFEEALLQEITQKQWCENVFYTCLSYILEALLCSPIYGSNPNEAGWTWLEHNPGFPQPTKVSETVYDI